MPDSQLPKPGALLRSFLVAFATTAALCLLAFFMRTWLAHGGKLLLLFFAPTFPVFYLAQSGGPLGRAPEWLVVLLAFSTQLFAVFIAVHLCFLVSLRNACIFVLCALFAISTAVLVKTLPHWIAALPALASLVAACLIYRGKVWGYSVGLAALFLNFLLGVAYVVGDAEEPALGYLAAPRFALLAAMTCGCIFLVWLLKRAQSRERARDGRHATGGRAGNAGECASGAGAKRSFPC